MMMLKLCLVLAMLGCALAFSPAATIGRANMKMSLSDTISKHASKILGVAAIGLTLNGPMQVPPAHADGAVSASTVFRARNTYGARIVDLADAVAKSDFATLEDKKVSNSFDLFISGSTAKNSQLDKNVRAEEKKIAADFFAGVKARDAGKVKAAYDQFIKVASLKSDFRPDERGQSDSSGYSPYYGTSREYIYQR